MIIYEFYAPGRSIDPKGPSVAIEYTTPNEPCFLEIDEQLTAQFLGLL